MSNSRTQRRSQPVLIFPGGMPRSLEYLEKCLRDGLPVIGASSLDYDVAQKQYPSWLFLPYITQPEFDAALAAAIEKHLIGGVYSPNPVVWSYLNRNLKDIAPTVDLVNESPIDSELNSYRAARSWARSRINQSLPVAAVLNQAAHLTELELASLYWYSELIPGMCDREKFCALYEVARRCPAGDIVEIGSWWGKSAFILTRLSSAYNIGNLLCVDPWSNEHLVQNDDEGLVDAESAQLDASEALAVFEMNLLPYGANRVNYLRMPSTEGAKHYGGDRNVTTATFGTTRYCGRISILHIDGNHSYAAARSDIQSWSGFVAGGGWIVVDDYVWPYGDGPRRAGDEFLAENIEYVEVAFVMGSALFIQMSLQFGAKH